MSLSPEGRQLLARLGLDLGRPHLASGALAETDTTDAEGQLLLGRALQALGDARGAEEAYAHAHRLAPGGPGTSLLAALLEPRQPARALPLYRLLIARDSLNPMLHSAMGRVYARLDSLPLAREHLARAFDLYPRGEATAIALAGVLEEEPGALAAHLDRALETLPRSPELWRLRGAAAMRAGNMEGAVAGYRNALVYDDSTAARLRDLGVALYYAGDPPEAAEVLRESYRRDSTDATTLRVYGFAANESGDTPLALRLLALAADAMGREPLADLYERTARVHSENLNDEAALEYLATAEALAPEKATIVLNRAIVLQQAGKLTEALDAYRAYAARAPEAEAGLKAFAEDRIATLETLQQRRIEADLRRRLNE